MIERRAASPSIVGALLILFANHNTNQGMRMWLGKCRMQQVRTLAPLDTIEYSSTVKH